MAEIAGELWQYNLIRVIVVDVTDDYRLMQPSMPADYYPVLKDTWLPRYGLRDKLPSENLVTGYLYDWHDTPQGEEGRWYVGVVEESLARILIDDFSAGA